MKWLISFAAISAVVIAAPNRSQNRKLLIPWPNIATDQPSRPDFPVQEPTQISEQPEFESQQNYFPGELTPPHQIQQPPIVTQRPNYESQQQQSYYQGHQWPQYQGLQQSHNQAQNHQGQRPNHVVTVVNRIPSSNVGLNGYQYGYELSDGTKREEYGQIEGLGMKPEDAVLRVRGSYSYVNPDNGRVYTVNYVADENGFRPVIVHCPKIQVQPV